MKQILFLLIVINFGFINAQGITGVTTTEDKYSNSVRDLITDYIDNKFELTDFISDDANIIVVGQVLSKEQYIQGFKVHHKLYTDIKFGTMFIDTTVYNEAFNNQVWSHLWAEWSGKNIMTGKVSTNWVNGSYKWVDGKIVNINVIYDPTELNADLKRAKIKL